MRRSLLILAGLGLGSFACDGGSTASLLTDCENVADGTACDDGDACSSASACASGVCVATAAVQCSEPADFCQVAACNPVSGRCETRSRADGTVCRAADGDTCTPPSTCASGRCEVASVGGSCPGIGACEVRSWIGGGWIVEPAPDGIACDDGLPCTEGSVCTAGACGGGEPTVCTTPNPCARAFCDPALGCVEELVADGTPCDDGDACSLESACSGGACVPTEIVECRDGPCVRSSSCNPETGRCEVEAEPDGLACDDRNVCTAGDFCSDGFCVPQEILPWEGEACADGICFRDVTATWGIDFEGLPPSINGHGAATALFDADGDGDLDALLGTETTPIRFYRNDGSGRFTEATAAAGLDVIRQSTTERFFAFAVGDIDNDGDPDLYVGMQDVEDYLFENDGAGVFTDVTATSGLQGTRDTNGADFGDFDNDGDLDLYVGHYIRERRFPFHVPEPNALYENQGDGRFREVTEQYRVGGGDIGGSGTTLIVRWSDYDRDGDLDLFECNDFGANVGRSRLYQNTGDPDPSRRFVDVSRAMNVDLGIYCMAITPGDYDRDGDLDFYFTNIGRHELYRNDAPGPFTEVTDVTGTGLQYDQCEVDVLASGWSAVFTDFDQDGWLDLFSANGYVFATDEFVNAEDVRNSVLRHDGASLTFTDVSRTAMASSTTQQSRGASAGDIDGDGDQDVLVANLFGPAELFENISPRAGGQVYVDVEGTISNRDGYHATVTAVFEDHVRAHEIDPHVGYQGVSEKAAHFGLGPADQIDEVRVRWPASGIEQSVFDVAAGSRLLVVEARTTLSGVSAATTVTRGQPTTWSIQLEQHTLENDGSFVLRVEDRTDSTPVLVEARAEAPLPAAGSYLRTFSFELGAEWPPGPRRFVVGAVRDDGAVDEVEVFATVQ